MDLSIYNVIVGPVLSEKAYKQNKQLKKLVLTVHVDANKNMIAQALERLFNVKVAKVNIISRKGKNRRVGRKYIVEGSLKKRAIITLASGYSLDMFDQAGASMSAAESVQTAQKYDTMSGEN
jgi:large subunit ribosomal protein L23